MKISDVLRNKGSDVVTIAPDDTVATLITLLADHGIGAVVVSGGDGAVDGIVSERDVVRRLHSAGPAVLDEPVSAIMTADVHTCTTQDEVSDLAARMTARRIRHVPVVEEDTLVAIVSIGDVVKHRIRDLSAERDHLEAYITQ
ncbi:CBS domain-containing protein [Janibacter cremeus]|uniref:CBS domain-containing protein n=1 Tax=Janibacter cremeus TaxID=1285192 RepID=A0A852VLE5_9MICO|nr:CBS domain-containing protein [Janibacter cremeus]NYF97897.1 CBS domain-containing protein [Janibacter cremeus]